MELDLQIEPREGYVFLNYRGPDSAEISEEIAKRALAACKEHDCYRVLSTAYMENPLDARDNYDLGDMFYRIGFPAGARWAWVDLAPSREIQESSALGALVLLNRGWTVRAFVDDDEALEWLLADE